jgi:hypothetical protein
MSGASAISSADLFGEEQRPGTDLNSYCQISKRIMIYISSVVFLGQRGGSFQSPDMYQLREGIGRMTEKVFVIFFEAKKYDVFFFLNHAYLFYLQISNVASGVLSTIQVCSENISISSKYLSLDVSYSMKLNLLGLC